MLFLQLSIGESDKSKSTRALAFIHDNDIDEWTVNAEVAIDLTGTKFQNLAWLSLKMTDDLIEDLGIQL